MTEFAGAQFKLQELPSDLARLIIEESALTDARTGFSLLQVSRQVQSWAERIVFRNVIVDSDAVAHKLLGPLLTSSKSPSYYANTIKSLCMTYTVPVEDMEAVLSACRGVEYLACWGQPLLPRSIHTVAFINLVTSLPLHSLSLRVREFIAEQDPDLAMFEGVKFLDIRDTFWPSWSWKGIASLKNLTHISLTSFSDTFPKDDSMLNALTRLLAQCYHLQVLLIRSLKYLNEIKANELLSTIDIRVVALGYTEPTGNWKRHITGGADDWKNAEQVILQRRTGLFNGAYLQQTRDDSGFI
jgi:hypothetical protein